MHPKPVDFKFNRDTYIFVAILAAIAGVGFIYTVVIMVCRSLVYAIIYRLKKQYEKVGKKERVDTYSLKIKLYQLFLYCCAFEHTFRVWTFNVFQVEEHEAFVDIFLRSMDLITIAVPPALPAALTIGIVFAQRRLKRGQIYCISPRSINVSGTINAVCFDKVNSIILFPIYKVLGFLSSL